MRNYIFRKMKCIYFQLHIIVCFNTTVNSVGSLSYSTHPSTFTLGRMKLEVPYKNVDAK